ISDDEINFPEVTQPNILVCLTQEAYTTCSPIIRPGGTLLADSRLVHTTRNVDAKQIELPMHETVMTQVGNPVVFNICVLGALVGILNIVRPESVLAAIAVRVPEKFLAINNRAFDLGLNLGTQHRR
ncbi:MAG: 2-oxoacid:acceptor oxidoreductase family protein, partial [Desulfobulbaceae bacterium]|nr:2-oxoacid:acceptor oxidoreductase family protein [Desulfobulbaceae bacterium]